MDGKGYYIAQMFVLVALFAISTSAMGCDVIGGIFKAGWWLGIIATVAVIGGVVMLVRMIKG